MNFKIGFKDILKRFGRNAAGFAIAYGVGVAGQYVGMIPDPYQPLVPFILGPALNAAAKAGRSLLDDGVTKSVCKVL